MLLSLPSYSVLCVIFLLVLGLVLTTTALIIFMTKLNSVQNPKTPPPTTRFYLDSFTTLKGGNTSEDELRYLQNQLDLCMGSKM